MQKILAMFIFTAISSFAVSQDWVQLNTATNMDLVDVFFINENIGFASGQAGTVIKTTDGGASWTNQYTGISSGVYLYSLYFKSENDGFAVGDASTIIRTTDGGNTWSEINSSLNAQFRDIIFWDENHGLILGGSNGTYLLTSDGGNTWITQPDILPEPIRGANKIDDFIYFVGYNGSIYRMDINSNEIISFDTNAPSLFKVDGTSEAQIAVGQNGAVIRTEDGWQSSELLSWNNSDWLADINYLNSGEFLGVGGLVSQNDGYIHLSSDFGNSWETTLWPDARLFSSCETQLGTLFVSGLDGTILKRASNQNICDTIIEESVTVNSCGAYTTESGTTLTASGIYQFQFTTQNGCDSIVELTLNIYPTPEITIEQSILECSNLQEVIVNATNVDVLTFQIESLNLTNQTGIFTTPPGDYNLEVVDINGCTSQFNFSSSGAVDCVSDFDHNNIVGISDLTLFIAAFGCVGDCCPYDSNFDGTVSVMDLLIFISNFGSYCN